MRRSRSGKGEEDFGHKAGNERVEKEEGEGEGEGEGEARAIDDERLDNDETCYPAGTVWVVSSCAQHLHALDLYS